MVAPGQLRARTAARHHARIERVLCRARGAPRRWQGDRARRPQPHKRFFQSGGDTSQRVDTAHAIRMVSCAWIPVSAEADVSRRCASSHHITNAGTTARHPKKDSTGSPAVPSIDLALCVALAPSLIPSLDCSLPRSLPRSWRIVVHRCRRCHVREAPARPHAHHVRRRKSEFENASRCITISKSV